MTTLVRIIITALLAIFASSCAFDVNFGDGTKGNGQIVEETRSVTGDFTVIHASEGMDVFVAQGNSYEIRVEADENIIGLIGTDIEGDKLKIHAIENIGRATKKVYVTLPEVTVLSTSSGADLISENSITAEHVSLNASSGSDIEVDLIARGIEADCSSGADITITGSTDKLVASASSGSDIKARSLRTRECNANASSGADISVNVTEMLVADASSGADISYAGDPTVKTNKSVSGSIRRD
ncbi:head GIN domain-containing protein [Croceivirga sp. JEA036]|uniref:head GIN domain-containing protein n=1 Tax=Croceivirga sp. JEA036 TaxID=2721162 RepID=UPI00143B04CF|nr:head GIN domain-containing protein [Croceivirga sp. JEA036]NJB37714.1 DUF2807 domain-containing protein [Croceivirga sp. JEA036]